MITALRAYASRGLHYSFVRHAITNLEMPAMSPTMTQGNIIAWKKKEGETFTTGDVLLEIETDKASLDVEAQDDGVVGKILVPEGTKNINVGKVIALLAEEGDDISNLEPPKEERTPPKEEAPAPEPQKAAPTPNPPKLHTPSHSRPLFPSVHRLLAEHGVSSPDKIKGTGVRGMLTKGDVLAFLGLASSPLGTYKASQPSAAPPKKDEPKPLDGPGVRRLIVSNMLKQSLKARNPSRKSLLLSVSISTPKAPLAVDFDSVLADYGIPARKPSPPIPSQKSTSKNFLDGLI